jgi:hypothetical protein
MFRLEFDVYDSRYQRNSVLHALHLNDSSNRFLGEQLIVLGLAGKHHLFTHKMEMTVE